jgi:hypothetical protein
MNSIFRFWNNNLKAELIKTFRVHYLIIVIILCYICALLLVAAIYGALNRVSLSLYSRTLTHMTYGCVLIYFIVYGLFVAFFLRPERPLKYIINNLKTNYLTRERFLNALPVFLFLPVFFSAFTSFKTLIPIINPFSWDTTFARWDAMLHGGIQPWKLLQPFIGHPFLTFIINFFYNIWFLVMYLVLFWQTFSLRDTRLRMQFFLSYSLSWILIGTLAAIVFSSAGPCFYGRVVKGEDVYRPLMEYLRSADEIYPIWAVDTQDKLWEAYGEGKVMKYNGISAMPSMHISMVFIFTLVCWRRNRYLGILLTTFMLMIIIGCIHLGWHYAVDAYVAIILTLFIWWFARKLLVLVDL